ncbi:MAG: helix-turn-helix transcriptional regulator [Clostridia bacterium]|nr:helix-turn-helix transcriptional regulator [Clostridia bacterium]
MVDRVKIGLFLAAVRKRNGLTQADLAERLGVSNKTVSR